VGVEPERRGVVQADADTHKTTATSTTRMTCFHHVGKVSQVGRIAVSSECPLPLLASYETFNPEEPSPSRFIPASVTRDRPLASITSMASRQRKVLTAGPWRQWLAQAQGT
jgi:hypothetical protein